jgi:hypothetical protein
MINRAPVLTLWASVVAERLGYDRDAALTLGKAVAGLTAQTKGRRLGIFRLSEESAQKSRLGEELWVELCGRSVPAKRTPDGLRAVVKDRTVDPAKVELYFEQKFGEDLVRVTVAMEVLASSMEPDELAERAYRLYERFRPRIPAGTRGWGAKGELNLGLIRSLADS